ncbi:baseplate J/gp47 family protein [Methylobacterium sp. 1973]|uniref:baseplate J/gp47 family protein n=1 Tax=Methylobacterium sp. 1973 TaxID=3156421 RepID=UPI0033923980
MPKPRSKPWPPEPNQTASGKPGAVHWLVRHGFELGLQPDPASPATGSATAAAAPNTIVPAGLQYVRADGVTYSTVATATSGGNSVSIAVEADVGAAAGDAPAGTVLTLVNPDDAPIGLATTCAVDAASDGTGLSGGADEESTESFRARVLFRKSNPPQGGAAADYAEWVQAAVPGATVYVDRYVSNAGSVWIQFTVLNLPAGLDPTNATAVLQAYVANPAIVIPSPGQVAAAQAYVADPVRRPVTAEPVVTAPTPIPVNVVIGKLYPDTIYTRAAVAAELAAVFLDRARPGTPTTSFVLSASWLNEAISRATGEDSHALVSPGDLIFTAGQYPVLGTITYQP